MFVEILLDELHLSRTVPLLLFMIDIETIDCCRFALKKTRIDNNYPQ